MKYRIYTNGKEYKIQRKKFLTWEWLDCCDTWCNWYGKDKPRIFKNKDSVDEFIKKQNWWITQDLIYYNNKHYDYKQDN